MDELKPKRKGKYRHRGNQKHGLYNGNSSLFNTWQTMIGRCENPNREKYKDYGGRGIKVCSEWHQASNFVLWALSNGYKKGLQIDRIDSSKGYSPDNCRWATKKQQSNNRKNTIFYTYKGETKALTDWASLYGINRYTLYDRIEKRGWSIEKALETPTGTKKGL